MHESVQIAPDVARAGKKFWPFRRFFSGLATTSADTRAKPGEERVRQASRVRPSFGRVYENLGSHRGFRTPRGARRHVHDDARDVHVDMSRRALRTRATTRIACVVARFVCSSDAIGTDKPNSHDDECSA
ncbi:MAG: hypothetical protein H6825_04590 [Planctomycetes bacterium]|nr:hypothetical protein [Planctomycetota bacterium]